MIREITRRQIEYKTAQGERVVLVEASWNEEYERGHIPTAVLIPPAQARRLAEQYLPNRGAEIVVYGRDQASSEADDVARQLASMGYGNLYVYRAGKKDWLGAGEFQESVHEPPVNPPRAGTPLDEDYERDAASFDAASAAE